jgi:hypothetical protein
MKFACADCGAANERAGQCTICGEGPLLDASKADVCELLAREDERAIRRRAWQLLPPAIVLTLALSAGGVAIIDPELLIWFLTEKGAALLIVATFGVWRLLVRLLPRKPRFAWLVRAQ